MQLQLVLRWNCWSKLDVVTFSFQKAIGSERAWVMMFADAAERLSYTVMADPKITRLTSKGKFNAAIFSGNTINTPSLLVIEDALDALLWGSQLADCQP